ncbi:DNA repair exonuclease [Lichenihabitans sp. Uapishka_5]|uniref:metallophosphoesterase family protein n=1 Tax=Lichenihabitans sp. Uapishka_5 TaxID=3037302 RepID=UPI0029E7FC89|nr:DNA repair exonuclease [Lichenihabitans sp. Uapishka_5]MDX7953086.1 DNA repair exonuclease [Lichenihabitans sp. Uapishka_5]
MGFRFLHTADWQIGKPFGFVPGDAGADLRAQRIRTIGRVAEVARERAVDAVLVAGDAFDANDVTDKTLVMTLEALKPFAGAWVFLPGNHDAAVAHSVWTRLRDMGLPPNLVIADEAQPIDRWDGRAHVLPAPLRRRREALDQTAWFAEAPTPDHACRVGLAHGSVAGRLPGQEASNEIPDDRAATAGLNYLALGDWHGALRIAPRIYYSGTPEPDRHKANRSGLVQLVELDGPGAPERVEAIEVGHFRWHDLSVDLTEGGCQAALDALDRLPDEPRRCVVSLRLAGVIDLAERRRLEAAMRAWEPRLHHLAVNDEALRDEPTADDLDAIDTGGFVRQAVERLRDQALTGGPDGEAARLALRMLYLDHQARA